MRHHPLLGRNVLAPALACLLMFAATVAIATTYPVLSQTYDEPAHVASGLLWLSRGTYSYEYNHPPLSRVAAAVGPYADGLRSFGLPRKWDEGNAILYARGTYVRNLSLARAGELPFFLIAGFIVWAWARRLFGDAGALLSVALFATLPPVLAHAGLATTDMAVTAMLAATLYSATRWLEEPTLARGAALGALTAGSVLAKFSALLFLPAAAAPLLVAWWWHERGATGGRALAEPWSVRLWGMTRSLLVGGVVAAFVAWATYHFSVGVVRGIPVPAPEFLKGIKNVAMLNSRGHPSYLLGRTSQRGWWYYFPVALAVKTTIPFLLFSAAGAAAVVRGPRARRDWRPLVPLLAAMAIIAVCLPSSINLGVRHILPVYPLLSIIAGYGALSLWRVGTARQVARVACVALLAWTGVTVIRAHPDYIAYFNALAGRHPEHVLADSNLDWGQDMLRLAGEVRARRIASISVAYFGTADLARMTTASVHLLQPSERATGWVAVSEMLLVTEPDHYAWIASIRPTAYVGKTIRLYYLQPAPIQSGATRPGAALRVVIAP